MTCGKVASRGSWQRLPQGSLNARKNTSTKYERQWAKGKREEGVRGVEGEKEERFKERGRAGLYVFAIDTTRPGKG